MTSATHPFPRQPEIGRDEYFDRNRQWMASRIAKVRDERRIAREEGNVAGVAACTSTLAYLTAAQINNNGGDFNFPPASEARHFDGAHVSHIEDRDEHARAQRIRAANIDAARSFRPFVDRGFSQVVEAYNVG